MISLAEAFSSLRVRILGAIFFIFSLAIGMVLYGVWTFERDRLVEMTSKQANHMSEMIVAGLRSSMIQNDWPEINRSIFKILQAARDTERIIILKNSGRIVVSSDSALQGVLPDRKTNSLCNQCHAEGKIKARTVSYENENGEKYINTFTPIENKPSCQGCHKESTDNIGYLLVETSFSKTAALLQELARRIVLTGIFTFLIGVLLLNYIVTRFFTKPIETLQSGFERVGRGDFTYWVDVKTGGEIGYMADAFNIMSRAIGRFVNEIKEKTDEVSAHYMIVHSLSQTIEKKKLKEVAVDLLAELFHTECVALALAVEKHQNIFEIVKILFDDKRHYHGFYNIESGDLELCALTQKDLLSWQAGKYDSYILSDDGSKLFLPLKHKNLTIGIFSIEKAEGETFTPAEKKIVSFLNHHLAVAFANAQLYDMAITDSMTMLYTRRHFKRKLVDFIEQYHETGKGFGLLMIDLDHFKDVNDQYGHPTGDKVLIELAGLITSQIRHGDLPFRYGGEEFAILLQVNKVDEAIMVAERLRRAVESNILQVDDNESITKTISIGVACCPLHSDNGDELIAAADSALYKAKNGGRNQVILCSKVRVN